VGRIAALPGAGNIIAGTCRASLDVRHADDAVRRAAVTRLIEAADAIAARRSLAAEWTSHVDQRSVAMDAGLIATLSRAVQRCGLPLHRMASGAGHDAMIVATRMPAAMLFLRSPRGISHHPDESVVEGDVAAALAVGREFLLDLAETHRE
jgi:allantoate deiminase